MRTNSATGPVRSLEVGTYGDLSRSGRAVVGDQLTPDHIPSFAAIRKAIEKNGPRLTSAEVRKLRNATNTIVVPHDIHALSRTYAGRNTAKNILKDSLNLEMAAKRDMRVFYKNARRNGMNKIKLRRAIDQLHTLNRSQGWYNLQ